MENSWIYQLDTWLIAAVLFQGMLLLAFIGYQVGLPKDRVANKEKYGSDPVTTALPFLLFLLIAVALLLAGSHFDDRRRLIVEEANAIGTALMRVDLYPEAEREAFREDFGHYITARIAYFEAGPSVAKASAALEAGQLHRRRIWLRTIRLAQDSLQPAASDQMIPALNNLMALTTKREVGEMVRIPGSIVILLLVTALLTPFIVGYAAGTKGRMDWLVTGGFCLLVSLSVYIVLDLDQPRGGLVNPVAAHEAMLNLRTLFRGQ